MVPYDADADKDQDKGCQPSVFQGPAADILRAHVEQIVIFQGIKFFVGHAVKVVGVKKAEKPQHWEQVKQGRKKIAEHHDPSPEQYHDAAAHLVKSQIHLPGSREQGHKKSN